MSSAARSASDWPDSTQFGDLSGIDDVGVAVLILDIEFHPARLQPSVVVVMNQHISAISQMDSERAKWRGAHRGTDLVGDHG